MTERLSRPSTVDYRGNGTRPAPIFSAGEVDRRHAAVRGVMAAEKIDAALFTSYHNICYLTGFLYCYFGRRYGLVLDQDNATTVTSAIDGGQPWRRSHCDNVSYTDWDKRNYFNAVRSLAKKAKRIGIEFDHVSLDFRQQLADLMPSVEFVDIAAPSMRLRMI